VSSDPSTPVGCHGQSTRRHAARYGLSIDPNPITSYQRQRTHGKAHARLRHIATAGGGISVLLICILTAGSLGGAGASGATAHVDPTTSWTVYHGDPLGSGVDTSGVSFSSATTAWSSPVLDGQVYGEPLEATGRVYVATENNTIYALAANTGAVLWSSHVGTPVPSADLPCGDISPTVGITGTPVLDVARGEIFAVADELSGSTPAHVLVGLNMYTGSTLLDQGVDPPGQDPAAILQRTGLNLSNGNVVFGYGGNDGDCSTYSGWVGSVPEGGGTPGYYQAVPIGNDGAVWMGGAAPEVDASGNIWVATGNGSSSEPYDFSDSVLQLSPGLARTQYFAPSNWSFMNSHDQDLGSTAPALLSNGTVLQVGKNQLAYLMNQSSLGGNTGMGIATASVCPGSIAGGGDAVVGNVVYVPCEGGLQAVQASASPPSVSVLWTNSSAHSPPISAGGLIWSIGGSSLYGINPTTGATVVQLNVGSQANHFPTPSVGDGLLLAPASDQVIAFVGSAGLPGSLLQGPPTSASVADGVGYAGQLTVSNPVTGGGPITWVTNSGTSPITVTAGGAVSAASTTAPGSYTVTGTESDTSGDAGSWTFTLTVAGSPTITSFTPASGRAGTAVIITGTNVEGATTVSFNGVAAKIKTDTATSVKVKVPTGASTGKIKIKTPRGKVKSAANFTIP
jgi:polyvinyl alcohol dehydrogenase (cytochrome)